MIIIYKAENQRRGQSHRRSVALPQNFTFVYFYRAAECSYVCVCVCG